MTDAPDILLLEQFARNASEEAFNELVQRHIGLVHSVALRHTANPQHAQDITQAVFIILARKAGTLGKKVVLPGWLYHTARLTAANLQRAEARRFRREQEEFMQSTPEESMADAPWSELSPQLDGAMAGLSATERDALVLRYFQNKSMAEVGQILGLAENTAQKRVGRALEKLRKIFARRGVSSTTAVIAAMISTNSVQAVPVGLTKTVSVVAVAKGATASASTLTLIKGALKLMAWTKAKTAILVTAGVLFTGTASVAIYNYNASRPIVGIPKGWSVLGGDADQWTWTDGKIHAHSTSFESILASSKTYRDVTLSVVVGTTNREASLAFRLQDTGNGYVVIYTPNDVPRAGDDGHIILEKKVSGQEIELGAYRGSKLSSLEQSAKVEVSAKGPWILVRLNDAVVLRCKDTTYISGFIGLRIFGDGDYPCDATFSKLTFY